MDKYMWKSLPLRLIKLIYLLFVTATFGVCFRFFYVEMMVILPARELPYALAAGLLYILLVSTLGRIYAIFAIGTSRISQLVYSHGLTLLVVDAVAYVVTCVTHLGLITPWPMLILFVVQMLWSVLWSYVANRLYFKIVSPRRTAILYTCESELRKFEEIRHFERKFCVEKAIQVKESEQNAQWILDQLEGMEAVFVAGLGIELRNQVAKYCINHRSRCYIQPRVGDVMMAGAEHMLMFSVPIVRIQKAAPAPEYLAVKRLIDIVASLLAIIVTSPFMLVTALAIKLHDGGPVLYKQVRLTKDYKEFKVLKFRSMRTDAEKDGVARLSTSNDDRITPVGKVIRAIRFDELPQLFNILKGDMTIVGPRPERPEIAKQYEEEIPSFGLRLQVKAGLTGYAQIYGKYNTEPYDKLKMDLMYINRMSLAEDIRLMFATVKILFMKESTEGVEEGQTTASHQSVEEEKEKELQNV